MPFFMTNRWQEPKKLNKTLRQGDKKSLCLLNGRVEAFRRNMHFDDNHLLSEIYILISNIGGNV